MTTSMISATKPGLQAVFASPYTPIGYVNGTPVYPIGGARSGSGISFAVGDDSGADPGFDDDDDDEDDEDDDRDEDENDAEDDEDDDPRARRRVTRRTADDPEIDAPDDDGEDWTPPTREAFDRMESALKRANTTAARNRRAGKTMQKLGIEDLPTWLAEHGIDPDNGSLIGNDVVDPNTPDDEPATDDYGYEVEQAKPTDKQLVRAQRAAEKRGEQKARDAMMPVLAQLTAEAALTAAGFKGGRKKLDRVLKLIDPRELELDFDVEGNFEVEGLDEQIATLVEEWPELFSQNAEEDEKPTRKRTPATGARPARRVGASSVDGGERGRQPAKPKTWLELSADRMVNRGRRG